MPSLLPHYLPQCASTPPGLDQFRHLHLTHEQQVDNLLPREPRPLALVNLLSHSLRCLNNLNFLQAQLLPFPRQSLLALLSRGFPCVPVVGNADFCSKEFHAKNFYDITAFANQPELRASMGFFHRYSLESFMTPRRFFYPRVVINFYHTITSLGECHPAALHFIIDGWHGVLRAANITATFQLLVALSNSVDSRQWPHPWP